MPKKFNDIDTAMIERAAYFSASIFVGSGQFRTEDFPTLEAAREAAIRFKAEVNNGRRGMVYAVTAEGRSALVPDRYQPSSKGEPAMNTETTLSSTQIAQLSAVITGGGMKRANSKEAAIKRFRTVLTEKVGDAMASTYAGDILGAADFQAASDWLTTAMEKASPKAESPVMAKDGARAKIVRKAEKMTTDQLADAVLTELRKPEGSKPASGKRAAILEAAQRGDLPAAPDFSAETHKRFRPKLAEVVALAEAGDLVDLKAIEIKPVSSSPKAIAKYRDLAVIALGARATTL